MTAEAALSHAGVAVVDLPARVKTIATAVGLRADLLDRPLNVDLSGGERKRSEIVQLCVLRPKVAILDEIDWASTWTRSTTSRGIPPRRSPSGGWAWSPITH